MPHLTFHTSSEDHTVALGVALGRCLRPGDVLGLDGELGAGKTRLVRGISEGLGLEPAQVSSPTYVLIHEYTLPLGATPSASPAAQSSQPGRFVETPLYHVDAYRLSGPDDLDSLGWERIMEGFGVVVIEWFERIAAALSQEPSLARVRIQHEPNSGRRIDLVAPPAWTQRPQWRGLHALADGGPASALPTGWATCPVTGTPVAPDCPTFPFATAKARMADLGRWLTGQYLLSRELTPDDADNPDLNP